MSREPAENWTQGKRKAVIMEIIIPDRVPADELAGLIHTFLRAKYPDLHSMEYNAFKIAELPLREIL